MDHGLGDSHTTVISIDIMEATQQIEHKYNMAYGYEIKQ